METTNKLTKEAKEVILQNPKVVMFQSICDRLENAGRIATIELACLVYKADHDGTNAAMGLTSAADFLIQVRGYSRSNAMNLQRVGKFLKGDSNNARDKNGNTYSASAIVALLESAENEEQARKFMTDGTVNALTSVKKVKKLIDAKIKPQIAAETTATETTETAAETTETADPLDKIKYLYMVDYNLVSVDPDGKEYTVKHVNSPSTLDVISDTAKKLMAKVNNPKAKLTITVTPRK